jgi:regulatory protein YycI of two-component signal transduction system YycFG
VDWSKTKTIFIITFLILDIFLAFQFTEKRNASQLDLITEASIEEQLEAEGITYPELPKEPKEGTYISGKMKFFTSEDIGGLKNQEVNIDNPALLQGVFKDPIKLPTNGIDSKVQQLLKNEIIAGEEYILWSVNEESGTILLFQQYAEKMFYNNTSNLSGILVMNINNEHEIISYRQTMLDQIEEYDEKEIIPAIKALENLYKNDHLKSGSEVTSVELGYYPLEQLSESQVLAPTWHIAVDDKVHYFVNAFEGQILEIME